MEAEFFNTWNNIFTHYSFNVLTQYGIRNPNELSADQIFYRSAAQEKFVEHVCAKRTKT